MKEGWIGSWDKWMQTVKCRMDKQDLTVQHREVIFNIF